ncbi:MAG: glycoside hydrolase family 2 [Anaerolineae bacterium]|nr:glycoside hydrolase family 2 [Anaerolineae bacterium]
MIKQTVRILVLVIAILSVGCQLEAQEPSLTTRWTADVTPETAHPEYPRPQLVRADWLNLNGLWQYALTGPDAAAPATYAGEILVPFPIESQLSGVQRRVNDEALWYQRTFTLPDAWAGQRVWLHFGAVDWESTVWVNGMELGTHRGGYDAFSFDLTDALTASGAQELLVKVLDPTDAGTQPRGKQVRRPESIWYTPTTGIWQTVWLEPVPETAIQDVALTPDLDTNTVAIAVTMDGPAADLTVQATVRADQTVVATEQTADAVDGQFTLTLPIEDPELWSPDSPFLYDVQIDLLNADQTPVDAVSSYFGMRKIALAHDDNGDLRLFLNDEPVFQLGLLDQGFWPDGLYTAPTDEALRYDIEVTRQLGFNTIRKHVKVEPERWYYWADKLGVLVWQDMPSGDLSAPSNQGEITRSADSAAQFELELQRLVESHRNHPSIIMWVPFNEGWGQYDTVRLTNWLKELDPTRLVNNTSGWNDQGAGDVQDIHSYPGPDAPAADSNRASVLGEFGGLGLPLSGHTWQAQANWGYREFGDADSLRASYADLITHLRQLIETRGLAAAIYTQTTDVEIEVNGMMTYNRAVIKMGAEAVHDINRVVYDPLPQRLALVPSSELEGTIWKYTTENPGDGWETADFDASGWAEGPGGFGLNESPLAMLRTEWREPELWLRRAFTLDTAEAYAPYLRVHHIEDAEIYLNGERIVWLPLSTPGYVEIPLKVSARALLQPGQNVLAVHVSKPSLGLPPAGAIQQYIDVGLYDMKPAAQ